MTSIDMEFAIDLDADYVWRVISDWTTGPSGMSGDQVVSTKVDGNMRVVTFADGTIVRERLVTCDDDARRLVYSLLGDTVRPEHDNAVMHIVPDGPQRCRFVWSRDVLPDELSGPLSDFMERSCPMIKHALEHRADASPSVI
jgi:Polyketide cyclase / dehydrase and lipid transport